jgi:uncharacterized protein (TIGR03067 family)
MLRATIALGTVLVATAGLALAEDNNGHMKLNGDYMIVAGEREGQKEAPERIQGDWVRFTGDTITVMDKDKKETYSATYTIDSSKKPCVITMTETKGPNKGEKARGLIEKRGNTIKLIYALPGGEAPTGFDGTKAKQLMFVLKSDKR